MAQVEKKKLSELRVVDLRAELEKRGLDKTGIKAVLYDRLQKAIEADGANVDEYYFDISPSPMKKATITKKATPEMELQDVEDEDEDQLLALKDDDEGAGEDMIVLDLIDEVKNEDMAENVNGVDEAPTAAVSVDAGGDALVPAKEESTAKPLPGDALEQVSTASVVKQEGAEAVTAPSGESGSDAERLAAAEEPKVPVAAPPSEGSSPATDAPPSAKVASSPAAEKGTVSPKAAAASLPAPAAPVSSGTATEGGKPAAPSKSPARTVVKPAPKPSAAAATAATTSSSKVPGGAGPSMTAGSRKEEAMETDAVESQGATPAPKTVKVDKARSNSVTADISLFDSAEESFDVSVDDTLVKELDADLLGSEEKKSAAAVKEEGETDSAACATGEKGNPGEEGVQGAAQPEAAEVNLEKAEDKKTEDSKKDDKDSKSPKSTPAAKNGKGKDDKSKAGIPNSRNLWVSGLASTTRASDLKTLFSKYGKVLAAKVVTNAKCPGSRCYGFVSMNMVEEAAKCIQHLHRTELHGKMISVEKKAASLSQSKGDGAGLAAKSPAKKVEDKKPPVVKKEGGSKKEPEKKDVEKKTEKKDEKDAKPNQTEKKDVKKEGEASKEEAKKDDKKETKKSDERKLSPASLARKRRERRPRSRGRKETRDLLSFEKIQAERERERLVQKERLLREERRRGEEELERERIRQMHIQRKQREEASRLKEEKEKLRLERDRLEREKLEAERLRIERERLERERENQIRRDQLRLEQQKRAMKRGLDSERGSSRDLWDGPPAKRPVDASRLTSHSQPFPDRSGRSSYRDEPRDVRGRSHELNRPDFPRGGTRGVESRHNSRGNKRSSSPHHNVRPEWKAERSMGNADSRRGGEAGRDWKMGSDVQQQQRGGGPSRRLSPQGSRDGSRHSSHRDVGVSRGDHSSSHRDSHHRDLAPSHRDLPSHRSSLPSHRGELPGHRDLPSHRDISSHRDPHRDSRPVGDTRMVISTGRDGWHSNQGRMEDDRRGKNFNSNSNILDSVSGSQRPWGSGADRGGKMDSSWSRGMDSSRPSERWMGSMSSQQDSRGGYLGGGGAVMGGQSMYMASSHQSNPPMMGAGPVRQSDSRFGLAAAIRRF